MPFYWRGSVLASTHFSLPTGAWAGKRNQLKCYFDYFCVKIIRMSFQYTLDAKGKPIGVFVPINEWEKITLELKAAGVKKSGTAGKAKILASIEKGMKQVSQIEKGKRKSIPLKQLLDAL